MQPDREGGRMDDDMQQQQDRRLKASLSLATSARPVEGTGHKVELSGTSPSAVAAARENAPKPRIPARIRTRGLSPPPPPAAPMQQQAQQIVSTTATPALITSPALRKNEPTNLATLSAPPQSIAPMNSYYSGGGFLSSLAAIQSLNPPQGFNQSINVGGGGNFGGGSSNMALLQGFNVPTFSSQQHHQQIQQGEFYQMGTRDNKNIEVPLYPSHQEALIPPSRTASSHQADWHQGFINSTTNPTPSNPGLWSSIGGGGSSSSTTTSNNKSNAAGSSMNPYLWPDLPGYGPPP
ncbi:hypothetical protein L1049_009988 [Liquidambar formosana]|uniref:Uncharacterized protein n=1 Tax=Liquidambar formosana TaxID=63359 RepID=A0AAP0N9E9_LIQFO